MKKPWHVLTAVSLGMTLHTAPAFVMAATITGTNKIPVTASVPAKCTLDTTVAVAFGNYDPASSTVLSANGSFDIQCTKNTVATITLGPGDNFSSGSNRMKSQTLSPSEYLNYSLAIPLQTNVTLPAGVVTYRNTSDSSPSTLTVNGTLPALQNVSVDDYRDDVTVTVSF
jgi:spore coat protein U-like protein